MTLFVAEPSALYLTKPSAVLDASVLCAMLFSEASAEEAVQHLNAYALHAPQLLSYELANVAIKKMQSHWPLAATLETLEDYSQMDIQLHPVALTEQVRLADKYQLSGYDAAYLWLAAHLKVPLLTFDRRLAAAAKTHLTKL
jgi:predicted nucleic acid-binding protein